MDQPKEDHNKREVKHLIMGGILDLLEKSSKTKEASYKWFTTLSTLDLFKIFSEVIVASIRKDCKDCKPGYVTKTGPNEKLL